MKILLVEDNPGDARLLREALGEIAGVTFELTVIETLARALETLSARAFDIGLLDLGLPDARGLEVVRRIHSKAPDMPLVVLSALTDEKVAVQSLHEGAQDYLVKAEFHGSSLWRALRYAMERQHLQLELRNLSLVDDLTGLSNRKGFLNLANHHVNVASQTGEPFLVGFIDLDNMKSINDTFGHQEGNRALVETAHILRNSFRQSDILARFGGDEFAVLVTEAVADSIAIVTHRVQEKVRTRNAHPGQPYALSMSIGIVTSDAAATSDLEQLLQRADTLMYQHKQEKRAARESPRPQHSL
jgi:two-component system cell cycle response regulator